ncbi:MAG: tRNA (adenosine(37)-N6)-threonylcarbamoyltransferase complex dimerization subunit type 1 TsaB [Deltaproteobacteria bacterium]|nr:MAG: tRNA (adenosine(37)-N6)-threonylcarbamoyltransferase complex dimerization subunit type 1 TsaB [Deltaproteobacteria bacterium]
MKLLAIDTSTWTTSVAVVCPAGVVVQRERAVDTHSDVLLALVDDALHAAGMTPADLDGVAVGAGPGSFTGLRIGMATAKGLCFALGVPLWTVSSLAALARDAGPHPGRTVIAALDAKKSEVFAAAYAVGDDRVPHALSDEVVCRPRGLAAALGNPAAPVVVGTAVAAYPDAFAGWDARVAPAARATPSAESVGMLALCGATAADLATAVPHYVRLSDAEINRRDRIP